MKEEKLKEAFYKIKEDILNLGKELSEIRTSLLESNQLMKQINEDLIKLKLEKITKLTEKTPIKTPTDTPTHLSKTPTHPVAPTDTPTHLSKTPTHPVAPTDTPTHAQEIQGLKSPNLPVSIGNEGVPTDRQTDKPTDRQIFQHMFYPYLTPTDQSLVTTKQKDQTKEENIVVTKIEDQELKEAAEIPDKVQREFIRETSLIKEKPIQQQIQEASEILDSLDTLKKEIRRKFKKITKQEMLVFSTIYELEEQYREVDYNKIALKLGLSQSSIRDYVQKMINKGIPITKEKLNNKKILLHISPELKKIASLSTIVSLREI